MITPTPCFRWLHYCTSARGYIDIYSGVWEVEEVAPYAPSRYDAALMKSFEEQRKDPSTKKRLAQLTTEVAWEKESSIRLKAECAFLEKRAHDFCSGRMGPLEYYRYDMEQEEKKEREAEALKYRMAESPSQSDHDHDWARGGGRGVVGGLGV